MTADADRPDPLADLAGTVRFLSRLPVPRLSARDDPTRLPDFRTAARAMPLAGALIALPAALVALLLGLTHLPPFLAAAVVVAAGLVSTGALHEDGLADVADGIGAGGPPERRLAIMKDSRIGGYGAAALMTVLLLRTAAVAAAAAHGPAALAGAVVGAAAASRIGLVGVWALLPTARPGGLADQAGRPTRATALRAMVLGTALSLAALPVSGFTGVALGLLLMALGAAAVGRHARATLGGQTGDVLGATQQVGEIGFLIGLLV